MLSSLARLVRTRLVPAIGALLFAAPAWAQTHGALPPEPPALDSLALRVQTLFQQGRQRESLDLLQPHLGKADSDYLPLVLAARAALALGYADPAPDSARAWLGRAISYGEEAQSVFPAGEDARYVTLAAKGRLALISSPIQEARLGREVEREALALLAMDSTYAGADNALGRVYLEIARLSWVERLMARPWLGGGIIGRASWRAAEYHLRRAIELEPGRNFYHLDLGRLLLDRDRLAEARGELEQALTVPLETPQQQGFRSEARALLGEIDRREGRDSTLATRGRTP